MSERARHRRIAAAIEGWFEVAARELPWREPKIRAAGGYPALVAELMLQQTQVSRVIDRFGAFLERFPTAPALAAADEDDVLAMWSGLGYYRRARLLHAAAKTAVERHDGVVPGDAESLRALPGVGAYTAGAVASIVFGERTPTVDGNIQRVLLRVDGIEVPLRSKEAERHSWRAAERLVEACERPGALNEGLMELGATVCTPASPRCGECPLEKLCIARREGMQARIPAPKARTARRTIHCGVVVVVNDAGQVLIEKRGSSGMWAGMWQAPTAERAGKPWRRDELGESLGIEIEGGQLSRFDHLTTHRVMRFAVHMGRAEGAEASGRRWVDAPELDGLGLSSPQRKILETGLGLARSGGVG